MSSLQILCYSISQKVTRKVDGLKQNRLIPKQIHSDMTFLKKEVVAQMHKSKFKKIIQINQYIQQCTE